MADKKAFVDYWTLAKNFARGDVVARWNHQGAAHNIPGTVTAVHPGIGFLDVEFPWGNERVSAEELLLINPQYQLYLPSNYDTSYSSYDIAQSHIEDSTAVGYSYAWPKRASAASFADKVDDLAAHYFSDQAQLQVMAQQCRFKGLSAMDSFRAITSVHRAPDHNVRQAIYWTAPGRKYRMNRTELGDGLPDCPKCGSNLQKTNYKKHTRLFVCPECLFCVKAADIEGLPEYVEESGFGVSTGQEEDLLTAALKTAKWDALKDQVLGYLKRKYRKHSDLHKDVADWVVGNHVSDMNVHEDTLSTQQLDKEVESALADIIRESLVGHGFSGSRHRGSLGVKIRTEVSKRKNEFHYPDEAISGIYSYVADLSTDDILAVDDREIDRLIDVQQQIDAERYARYAVSFHRVVASMNPSAIELREVLGQDGMNLLYEEVRDGTTSPVLAEQFHHDLETHGFGDALFLLSASTADGLFNRETYNRLVDVLDHIRTPRSS